MSVVGERRHRPIYGDLSFLACRGETVSPTKSSDESDVESGTHPTKRRRMGARLPSIERDEMISTFPPASFPTPHSPMKKIGKKFYPFLGDGSQGNVVKAMRNNMEVALKISVESLAHLNDTMAEEAKEDATETVEREFRVATALREAADRENDPKNGGMARYLGAYHLTYKAHPEIFAFVSVIEFMEGRKMASVNNFRGKMGFWDTAKSLLKRIAFMQDCGVTHGDLSPSNILLHKKELYVIDFGLSFFHNTASEFNGREMSMRMTDDHVFHSPGLHYLWSFSSGDSTRPTHPDQQHFRVYADYWSVAIILIQAYGTEKYESREQMNDLVKHFIPVFRTAIEDMASQLEMECHLQDFRRAIEERSVLEQDKTDLVVALARLALIPRNRDESIPWIDERHG